MNIVEKVTEIQNKLENYFEETDINDSSAAELYGFLEGPINDAIDCAKKFENLLLEKDMAYAEAMALVMSHEGRIDKLNAELEEAKTSYRNACMCLFGEEGNGL